MELLWREQERKQPIETAGKLITSETFDSVDDLKKLLVTNHRSDFYRCLTEKFLTYAIGRGLEYYDEPVVRRIKRRAAPDYRWSSLILEVIKSEPFQMRRTRQP